MFNILFLLPVLAETPWLFVRSIHQLPCLLALLSSLLSVSWHMNSSGLFLKWLLQVRFACFINECRRSARKRIESNDTKNRIINKLNNRIISLRIRHCFSSRSWSCILGISICCFATARSSTLVLSLLLYAATHRSRLTVLHNGGLHYRDGWRMAQIASQTQGNLHRHCLRHQLLCWL